MASKQKRILFIDLGASMGGVESYLIGLAGMLDGHADLFAVCILPELAEVLRRAGVRVSMVPAFKGIFKPLRFVVGLAVILFVLLLRRIDVIQVNGLLESLYLLPARMLGREAVYTRHGPFEDDLYSWFRSPHKYFPRLASKTFVRFATHTVCVSETVGRAVRRILPAEKMTVIPNWVSKIPDTPKEWNQAHEGWEILYVGRLERYKGVQFVIDALRGVPEAKLTVVGDGTYRKELESMAEGVNVEFAGFRKDTEVFYRRADVFVMPSMGPEGLPMVSLEAMGHGLPCIFSDLEVHEEITEDGYAAMLFESGRAKDLAAQLNRLFGDRSLAAEYGRRARELVLRKYHPAAARRAYWKVFGVAGEALAARSRGSENLNYEM
ncbi:glycosyltransferase family 4 protein [Silvibacterium dinghuense]|uniref:Glycosyltransferase family 1 protein n=1 Tax=Silvibacterium dinghuense TaxID=1560006 RepID=A0A4Q1SDL9_9BACT|nr:glycosyltransferase family 4 protein [Silvibacterium dinghuense]RXS95324.1 glycosyltransferase family 1 protein [Silvibacterium dinghuense]GGH12409.1 hypothetical protein GCM10011586_31660 [Silvibacterium dinghuense]